MRWPVGLPTCPITARSGRSRQTQGPQLRHGQNRPQREHKPSAPGAGNHTAALGTGATAALGATASGSARGTGAGSDHQCSKVRPSVACTARSASMRSQLEVLAQGPRQRSATEPSDHSTPSASVPVPRSPDASACRTSRKSRACRRIVFMPTRIAHLRPAPPGVSSGLPEQPTPPPNSPHQTAAHTPQQPTRLPAQHHQFCRRGLVAFTPRTATTRRTSERAGGPAARTGAIL
jgi:hypothetical protein